MSTSFSLSIVPAHVFQAELLATGLIRAHVNRPAACRPETVVIKKSKDVIATA
jgi:hypothetical protein